MFINRITAGSSAVSSGVSAGGGSVVISQTSSGGPAGSSAVSLSQASGFSQSYENKLNITSAANNIATNISVADQALAKKADTLQEMKQNLNASLREFDYQPLKNNKLQLVGNYVALRMLMVRDTVPPEFEFAWKITTEETDQTVTLGSGGPSVTVRSQSVIIGGDSGISVPELSEAATKEQISAAIQTIDSAQKTITEKRAALASDTANIADSLAQTVTAANTDISMLLPDEALQESGAEEKSKAVSRTIPSYPGDSVTGANTDSMRVFL